jgi:hypothetical protein
MPNENNGDGQIMGGTIAMVRNYALTLFAKNVAAMKTTRKFSRTSLEKRLAKEIAKKVLDNRIEVVKDEIKRKIDK